MSTRQHFEGLLDSYLKQVCRKPIGSNKAIPEIKTTFREGFKCALIVLEVIQASTTELSPEMFDILCSRLEEMTGLKPPPPDENT